MKGHRFSIVLLFAAILCFCTNLFAEDKKAEAIELPTVEVKADTVTIARDQSSPGIVTVFVMTKDTPNESRIQENIDAMKSAIKLLEQRIDVCKKGLKEEKKNKMKEKVNVEVIPEREVVSNEHTVITVAEGCETCKKWPTATNPVQTAPYTQHDIHYTKDGTAYMVVPAGTDLNDPKYWMAGDKPFCSSCWKTK